MCGIFGYLGPASTADVLLTGLKRLEYRGYDSAGLVIVGTDGLQVRRVVGGVNRLQAALETCPLPEGPGIAHTRWSTHGRPSVQNAHPHLDFSSRFAIVHNGIIENAPDIQSRLKAEGIVFRSRTDSEALAHLIGFYYNRIGDIQESIRAALKDVQGTYGLVVASPLLPDSLIAARRGSPLVVGLGTDSAVVASDQAALLGFAARVSPLDDNEQVTLQRNNVTTTTLDARSVTKTFTPLKMNAHQVGLDGYPHFMLKEICEQPQSLKRAFRGRLKDTPRATVTLNGLADCREDLQKCQRLLLFGCGTAWHAALVGKYLCEEFTRIPCQVEYSSELRYRNPVLEAGTLGVAVSQSGETADTLAALRELRARDVKVLGLVNGDGSSIAQETDAGIYLQVGPEIGVASTKAFTAQLAVLTLLAAEIGICRQVPPEHITRLLQALHEIPKKLEHALECDRRCRMIAERIAEWDNCLYLGRGINFPVALEGALKLKEVSYIHAEGLPAAEMKHGPIAMIDEGMPVIVIASRDHTYEKILSNMEEVKARGGRVIAVAEEGDTRVATVADDVLTVPATHELLSPLVNVVPLQLLAYHGAVLRGCNVDQPRNLAKSVTVE